MTVSHATTTDQIKACFLIREQVFMREQGVTEAEEWDGLDDKSLHFLATDTEGPAGTARLLIGKEVGKVQRVAVLPRCRGTGLGARIMRCVIREAETLGCTALVLESQTHAIGFYETLGFAAYGPVFDDAGIPHRSMRLDLA